MPLSHPLLQASDALSDSRNDINSALHQVAVHTTAVSLNTVSVETHGTHILVDATSGALTITLPDPSVSPHTGVFFVIKKVDASINAVTVDTTGSETIDGVSSKSLAAQWDSITVFTDDSNWFTAPKV